MSEKALAVLNTLHAYAKDNPGKKVWFIAGEDTEAYHRFNQARVIARDETKSIDILHRKITLVNGSTLQFMSYFATQLHIGETCNFAAFQGNKKDPYWTDYVLPALYRDPDPLNKRHLFLE